MSARGTESLTLNFKRQPDGALTLAVPAVGRFRPHPRFAGAQSKSLCAGGDELGTLEWLGLRAALRCPAEMPAGHITLTQRGLSDVAWGDIVATLSPAVAEEGVSLGERAEERSSEGWVIEAPIDGTVYYSPSPEAAPFVALGALIEPGQVIALIEVMKFYYEIKHEGSEPVRALSQGATHGAPIEAGEALWRVTSP